MLLQLGDGIFLKMKNVAFVIHLSTRLVQLANILEMNVLCVSKDVGLQTAADKKVMGQCNHSFHMHCVLKWIQQESSKGTCPMCRGSELYTERGKLLTEDRI